MTRTYEDEEREDQARRTESQPGNGIAPFRFFLGSRKYGMRRMRIVCRGNSVAGV
jgi:hypothetical protein